MSWKTFQVYKSISSKFQNCQVVSFSNLMYAAAAASLQSCPTLCSPMDGSPPGSSVHGISRQEYWSGLPFPSPGDLPNPGIEARSPALQADSLLSETPGKLKGTCKGTFTCCLISLHLFMYKFKDKIANTWQSSVSI